MVFCWIIIYDITSFYSTEYYYLIFFRSREDHAFRAIIYDITSFYSTEYHIIPEKDRQPGRCLAGRWACWRGSGTSFCACPACTLCRTVLHTILRSYTEEKKFLSVTLVRTPKGYFTVTHGCILNLNSYCCPPPLSWIKFFPQRKL